MTRWVCVRRFRGGAAGSCSRTLGPAELADAARTVVQGGALFAPTVMFADDQPVRSQSRPGAAGRAAPRLDALEGGILGLAAGLVIDEATVKTHVARILLKLGLGHRVLAVGLPYERGVAEAGHDTSSDPQTARARPGRHRAGAS